MVNCQGNYWTEVTSPFGVWLSTVMVNSKGHIFTASANIIYRSMDKGQTWSHIDLPDSLSTSIHSFAATQTGTILFGAARGILRSTDNGESWSQTFYSNMYDISFAISSQNHIYVGSEIGVLHSTDDGQNWSSTGLSNVEVNALIITDSGHILAAVGDILYSTDEGETWYQSLIASPGIISLAKAPNGHLLGGSRGRVWRSTDEGLTWSLSNKGLPNGFTTTLAVNTNGDIFAGVRYVMGLVGEGIYRSTDEGKNWICVNNGILNTFINCITVGNNGDVFTATGYYDGGVFRSTDNGDHWNILPVPNNDIIVISTSLSGELIAGARVFPKSAPMFFSTDQGSNWHLRDSGLSANSIYEIAINNVGSIFTVTDSGLFVSTNNGNYWRKVNSGFTYGCKICFDSSNNIFIGTYGTKIFRSLDNGQTWDEIFRFVSSTYSAYITDLIVSPSNHLYCSVFYSGGYGVYRSTDGGINWFLVSSTIPSNYLSHLAVNLQSEIFGVSDSGYVYRTTDDGSSWICGNSKVDYINDLVINSSGTLFIATYQGVYYSQNKGDNWDSLNTGLTDLNVQVIGLDLDGYLYASTYLKRFYRTVFSTGVENMSDFTPMSFTLYQNYPNPFNPSTTIEFSITSSHLTKLKIFNTIGQEIETLIDEIKYPGLHKKMWDAKGVSSGVYYYRLIIGDKIEVKKMVLLR